MVRSVGVLKKESVEGLGKIHGKLQAPRKDWEKVCEPCGDGPIETGIDKVWWGVLAGFAKGPGPWRVHESLMWGSAESLDSSP